MFKILVILFVVVLIFTSVLYLGIFGLLGNNIEVFTNDFLPFVPLEIRLAFGFIILGTSIAFIKSFTH